MQFLNKKSGIYILCLLFVLITKTAFSSNVLFIGNSFTGYSESAINSLKNRATITDSYEFDFVGGMRLSEHAINEKTLNLIRSKNWDYVVLQGHSKEPLIWFDEFYNAVEILSKEIRKKGSTPVLFMTWARVSESNYVTNQKTIIERYNQIGKDFNIGVVPIGKIFLAIYSEQPSLFKKLYQKDGIHQTPLGSYIVANSFYKTFHRDISSLPPSDTDKQTLLNYINFHIKYVPITSRGFIAIILETLLNE